MRKFHHCGAFVALATLIVGGHSALADDKPALAGAWAKKGGEMKIEFADKGVLKISPHGKDDVILIVCKYTIDKQGLVKVKISELEGTAKEKAQQSIPVGLEFTFKWSAKNDAAMIGDLKGENVDILKSHLEGDYEKK